MEPKLLGVCSWIAKKYNFDINLVRIGFAIAAIGFGVGIGAYLVIFILLQLKFIE